MTGSNLTGNLYLTGFMGSGKSAAAHELHIRHGYPVIEMDLEIERQEGMRIPEIFRQKGEAYFRQLESDLLESLCSRQGLVVSCGGGVPLRSENVEKMHRSGRIVLLQASPETILERTSASHDRPLLEKRKNPEDIRRLMEERKAAYEAAADWIIDTEGKSIRQVCEEILSVC